MVYNNKEANPIVMWFNGRYYRGTMAINKKAVEVAHTGNKNLCHKFILAYAEALPMGELMERIKIAKGNLHLWASCRCSYMFDIMCDAFELDCRPYNNGASMGQCSDACDIYCKNYHCPERCCHNMCCCCNSCQCNCCANFIPRCKA